MLFKLYDTRKLLQRATNPCRAADEVGATHRAICNCSKSVCFQNSRIWRFRATKLQTGTLHACAARNSTLRLATRLQTLHPTPNLAPNHHTYIYRTLQCPYHVSKPPKPDPTQPMSTAPCFINEESIFHLSTVLSTRSKHERHPEPHPRILQQSSRCSIAPLSRWQLRCCSRSLLAWSIPDCWKPFCALTGSKSSQVSTLQSLIHRLHFSSLPSCNLFFLLSPRPSWHQLSTHFPRESQTLITF